jgi:hypothetical protein
VSPCIREVWSDLTPYPVHVGGSRWTALPPLMFGLNSKTTLVDSGGRSTVCMAFRRSGVRIPSGPHLPSRCFYCSRQHPAHHHAAVVADPQGLTHRIQRGCRPYHATFARTAVQWRSVGARGLRFTTFLSILSKRQRRLRPQTKLIGPNARHRSNRTGPALLGRDRKLDHNPQSILEWKKKRSLRSSLPPLNPGRESTPQIPPAMHKRRKSPSAIYGTID